MEAVKHIHIIISGRVQGVWFRSSTKEKADELGIKGWVRNLPNREVEIEAQGGILPLEKFIEWCHSGPPGADVTNVEIENIEHGKTLMDFRIIR